MLYFFIYSVNIRTLFRFSKLDCTFLSYKQTFRQPNILYDFFKLLVNNMFVRLFVSRWQAIRKKFGLLIMYMYDVQTSLTYTNITIHILLCNTMLLYIRTYTYLHILIYQLTYTTLCKYAIQYIKEQHNNNVFNAIKKVLNHRLCYTIITV